MVSQKVILCLLLQAWTQPPPSQEERSASPQRIQITQGCRRLNLTTNSLRNPPLPLFPPCLYHPIIQLLKAETPRSCHFSTVYHSVKMVVKSPGLAS